MGKELPKPFGQREGARKVTRVEVHPEAQKVIDLAMEKAIAMYLHACEMAEKLRLDRTDQNKEWDRMAHERCAGAEELLGALLDVHGYDVRMDSPTPPGGEPSTFITWVKTERHMVTYGYRHGLIEREHMLAWFNNNQENGWLRDDKVEIPA